MTKIEPTGRDLRDAGIDATIAADEAVHRELRAAVEAVLDALIAGGKSFTSDDLQERLPPDVRDRAAPSLVPAVFAVYSRQKRISCIGYETSTRRSRHAGAVRRWAAA